MTYDVTFADLQAEPLAAVQLDVSGPDEIPGKLGPALDEVADTCAEQQVPIVGPPLAHYRSGPGSWHITVGFPVARAVDAEGRVVPVARPGQRYALATHVGPYGGLPAVCDAVRDYALENGFEFGDDWWERYLDGPGVPRPRTEVLVACHRVRPHSTQAPEQV